jgi:thiamine-phosphate pyrophosphorylase
MTRLIVISAEQDVANEAEIVNELFRSGMQLFHLRKPKWNEEQQRSFLSKIGKAFLKNVSVHQHHSSVKEFDLKYCHFNEKMRLENAFAKISGVQHSTSFHDYNDLQFESHNWNYCFLSPVFDSISKAGYKSKFGKDFNIESDLYQRVIALGGITENNIDEVFKKEFYGAAVLGAIWSNPEKAINNFITLNKKCNQFVHTS